MAAAATEGNQAQAARGAGGTGEGGRNLSSTAGQHRTPRRIPFRGGPEARGGRSAAPAGPTGASGGFLDQHGAGMASLAEATAGPSRGRAVLPSGPRLAAAQPGGPLQPGHRLAKAGEADGSK